jgi:calcineurin-like phosphoesterase family protein
VSRRTGPKGEDYVIADLHLGHKNVINMPGREIKVYRKVPHEGELRSPEMGVEKRIRFQTIEEHDDYVIEKINQSVPPDGHLWILGDIAFNRRGFERLFDLKCGLSAVLGNHDSEDPALYPPMFDSVCGAVKGTVEGVDIIMTHIPVHPCQKERFGMNIHGHMHTQWIDDDFYSLVSCEHIDFTPIQLRDAVLYNGVF